MIKLTVLYGHPTDVLAFKNYHASSDGDLGYEIGTFELKFQGEDGSIITDTEKYTELLKRNSEGK